MWHEPFYVKIGGWQLYYETRNLLVTAAVHFPADRRRLCGLVGRRLLIELLTYRYYNAALILRAVEDYLSGSALFDGDPRRLHAELDRYRMQYPAEFLRREVVAPALAIGPDPRGRRRFLVCLAATLLRNALAATRPSEALEVPVRDFLWFRIRKAERLAVETYWDPGRPVFARSREAFRQLSRQGVATLLRLFRNADQAAEGWRKAHPGFTSEAAWRRYLGLDTPVDPNDGPVGRRVTAEESAVSANP